MNLLDRISLNRAVKMLLDFILAVLKLFMEPNKTDDKRKPRWRR